MPDQISLEGHLFHINKLYLRDEEAVIGRRFLLNLFQNMNATLLFINSTVTAMICFSCILLFDSHSRDARGLAVSDGSSVLLKFSNIQKVENYIQVAYLKFQGRERQYFQLQFINVEIDDVEDSILNINRDIRRLQRNYPFLRRENLSKCSRQYKTLKDKFIFSGNKLKEIENKQRRFNYQKIRGTVQHDKRKKQMCSYYHKKTIMSTSRYGKVSKFKELIKDGTFFICVVCHYCLYRRSLVIFDQNKYNLEIPPLICIMLFDSSTYICTTCRKKCQKCEIPCQSVSNKLEVFDLPTEFQSISKLERVLIAEHIIFKK